MTFTATQRRAAFWSVGAATVGACAVAGAVFWRDAVGGAVLGVFGGLVTAHGALAVMPGPSLHCPMAGPAGAEP